MEASKKRHDATDVTTRNQQAFFKNIETQLGQLNKFFNEQLPLNNPDP